MASSVKQRGILKEFGLNPKILRLRARLSQYEIAARLGIHPRCLNGIEWVWRDPSPELLARLHELIGVGSDGKEVQP